VHQVWLALGRLLSESGMKMNAKDLSLNAVHVTFVNKMFNQNTHFKGLKLPGLTA
jgi:hypothetical protein